MIQEYLEDLTEGRPVRVGQPRPLDRGQREEAARWLAEFERQYRLTLPGESPDFDASAAVWSASSLYLSTSLLIHRDAGVDAIEDLLSEKSPDRSDAKSHYAVDLTMRFLPELFLLVKSASSDDPLASRLTVWAKTWPLSSVGIETAGSVDAVPLRTSPALMRLYIDRIIARSDIARLDDPVVAEMAAAAIGDYPELSPTIAHALTQRDLVAEGRV